MFHYLVSISWFHHDSIVDRAFLYFSHSFRWFLVICRKFDSFPRQIRNAEWPCVLAIAGSVPNFRHGWVLITHACRYFIKLSENMRANPSLYSVYNLFSSYVILQLSRLCFTCRYYTSRFTICTLLLIASHFPTWDHSVVLEKIWEARERSYLCLERVIYSRN